MYEPTHKLIHKTKKLVDVRQTFEYAKFLKKLGWQVKKINPNNQVFIKKLSPTPFTLAKILRGDLIDLITLKNISKKNKTLFIKIQPFIKTQSKLKNFKFKHDKNPLIPTKTVWIDLTKTKAQMLKLVKPKTRYNIKLAKKKKVLIKIVYGNQISRQKLKDFYNLWKKNKPYNFLFKPSFKELECLVSSFGKKCFFILTYKAKLLSGVLILTSPDMAFYWHNCSNLEAKKLFAPTLCVWQAILESKKLGLKIFDFEGIWDKRFPKLNKGWQGFSRFKKSFGGKEVEFIAPLIYKLLLPSWT
ncbi:lipid II:glycine glycyltransferase FemX [Patescibacteria group bacterium]